ncbi:MAG: hydroxyacid dehydrogenase [Ruminococcaceae bacterium]|nr:hydroxyacid dehydrogenase [Oscillospiraceae bacterium]
MKIVILDAATLGADIDLSPITSLGETAVYQSTHQSEVAARLADADVAVLNKLKMNEESLKNAHRLRLICVSATGYDNIDTAYCKRRGIALYNVPGYSTDSVAQLTAAMALSLATHLTAYRDHVHSGAYTAGGVANHLTPVFHELSSMTWGVVGGGAIGTRVAEIAEALGCRVLLCRRKLQERFHQVPLEELLKRSDIVSLHVPLTAETRGMIGKAEIAQMKDGAILINVARGAVTDEAAVAEAIEAGKLGGLGVDVYSTEPFSQDHPFTRLTGRENVCLTPHMAWGSAEARARCVGTMAANIQSFLAGCDRNRIV